MFCNAMDIPLCLYAQYIYIEGCTIAILIIRVIHTIIDIFRGISKRKISLFNCTLNNSLIP